MSPSAAAPSPQEVLRKLSVHSAARPTGLKDKGHAYGTSVIESDSESATDNALAAPSGLTMPNIPSPHPPPGATPAAHLLSAIAERRDGSGAEDSEDEDDVDEGAGGWNTRTPSQSGGVDDCVLKSGYLWKKGERRKTWKKRWFVLRPAHLAYYKTNKEYQLLRLLELSDVHSCIQVSLKKHENTFGLVSAVRTFYLQAQTPSEMQGWVSAIEESRLNYLSNTARKHASNPIPIPSRTSSQPIPSVTPSPPYSFPSYAQNVTSSDSEDAGSTSIRRTQSISSSQQRPPVLGSSPPKSIPSLGKESSKTILSGYLMKCGSKRRNWRKRWFVLTGEKLFYTASHMDSKAHRQFALTDILDALEYDIPARQLSQSTGTAPVAPQESNEPDSYTFKIITTKRTLLLCAPGEEDEIKWLGAIRALIARRSNAGVVPGEPPRPGDVHSPTSGLTSAGHNGIRSKVRRLSTSGSMKVTSEQTQGAPG